MTHSYPNTGVFLGPVISFSLTLRWKKLICFCLSHPLHIQVAPCNSIKGSENKAGVGGGIKKEFALGSLFFMMRLADWVSVPSNKAGEEPEGQKVKKRVLPGALRWPGSWLGMGVGDRQGWVRLLWVWEVHQKGPSVHWAPGLPVLEYLVGLFLRHDYLSTELKLYLAALRGKITPRRRIFRMECTWEGRIYP